MTPCSNLRDPSWIRSNLKDAWNEINVKRVLDVLFNVFFIPTCKGKLLERPITDGKFNGK